MGPVFVLCWPLFPTGDASAAKWAALVPAIITAKFAAVGLGVVRDRATVESMCRTGDSRELLRGPLVYGLIMVLATLLHWLQQTAVTAILVLCAGDGAADLVGRRFGAAKLPWSPQKSWAGSAAFVVASVASGAFFYAFASWNGWPGTSHGMFLLFLPRLCIVSAVAAAVESLPIAEWDNASA